MQCIGADDNTVMTENPAYNITPGLQYTNVRLYIIMEIIKLVESF